MIQLDLFEQIRLAMNAPQEAQLLDLLHELDIVIANLDDQLVLAVAADAILQLATILEAKCIGVVEEVKLETQANESRDPIVPIDFFDFFVRQSMLIDFAEFIEPIPLLSLPSNAEGDWWMPNHLRTYPISESAMVQEIREAMIDDAAELLDALPDRHPKPPLDIDAIKAMSHGEEIEVWTSELMSIMEKLQTRKRKSISLLDLVCTLESFRSQSERKKCLIDLWMAFLLGKHSYQIYRPSKRLPDFYNSIGIKVVTKEFLAALLAQKSASEGESSSEELAITSDLDQCSLSTSAKKNSGME